NNVPVELITNKVDSKMLRKVDSLLKVDSYYYFIKAINHYLLANNLHNAMFINDNCDGYEEYKINALKEDFSELVKLSGVTNETVIAKFAKEFINQMDSVIVFSEKEVSANASYELFNLNMITGKLGKTASGLIALKEKNNSQGLFDMGIEPNLGVGSTPINNADYVELMKKGWGVDSLPTSISENIHTNLVDGSFKNLFVFGEDPMGTAKVKDEVVGWFDKADFVMVQDNFMTETAREANLILPASMPIESGGSFTNTQKAILEFDADFTSKVDTLSYEQLTNIIEKLGVNSNSKLEDIRMEAISFLSLVKQDKLKFVNTNADNNNRLFDYGCDYIVKYFDDDFAEAFE
ncbi:MAG: molybdopterin-dependent oxidoreductase, partial [Bacteroidota bacterium]